MIKYIYPIAVLVTTISCKQNQDTKLEEKKSSKKVESEIVIQEEQYIENDSILVNSFFEVLFFKPQRGLL